jgi:hypothetical protein
MHNKCYEITFTIASSAPYPRTVIFQQEKTYIPNKETFRIFNLLIGEIHE